MRSMVLQSVQCTLKGFLHYARMQPSGSGLHQVWGKALLAVAYLGARPQCTRHVSAPATRHLHHDEQ